MLSIVSSTSRTSENIQSSTNDAVGGNSGRYIGNRHVSATVDEFSEIAIPNSVVMPEDSESWETFPYERINLGMFYSI